MSRERLKAILVDVDRTIALPGDRNPYIKTLEESELVLLDRPNSNVITAVNNMWYCGHEVVFVSGRYEICRKYTEQWLREYVRTIHFELFMRSDGDNRPDAVVKEELYLRNIKDKYDIAVVFDDRDEVVEMWRKYGLTCFQVDKDQTKEKRGAKESGRTN